MNDRHQLFIGLFIFMVAIGLGVWQWNELQGINERVVALQTEAGNLRVISSTLADDYKDIKVDVTSAREEKEQALSEVLPLDENITMLTRTFDDYAVKNNFESNPFFIGSIQYASPSASEEVGASYRSTTLDLKADASKRNLSKFLEMIESSGSLEAGTRLMDVDNLTVSYPSEYGGTYELRAEIRAYYAPSI